MFKIIFCDGLTNTDEISYTKQHIIACRTFSMAWNLKNRKLDLHLHPLLYMPCNKRLNHDSNEFQSNFVVRNEPVDNLYEHLCVVLNAEKLPTDKKWGRYFQKTSNQNVDHSFIVEK